ncbi:MAG: hypothetical protein ACQESP_06395 [Candidatus Muiribacteriota bacterium]
MKSIKSSSLFKYKSVLISGGVNSEGEVPVLSNVSYLKELKKAGLKINLHTGVLKNKQYLKEINKYVDCISFDLILDKQTINEIYKGFYSRQDFLRSFDLIQKNSSKFVVHILSGIYYGRIKGEYEIIDFLCNQKVKEVVILVLKPQAATSFSNIAPPSIDDMKKFIKYCTDKIPVVTIGCMRPGGKYRQKLDLVAFENNVRSFVMPHKVLQEYTKNNYYDIRNNYECCVF